jgi:transposase-like protein
LRAGKTGAHEPFFLSEQRARLTPNVFTQLFQRLCTRVKVKPRVINVDKNAAYPKAFNELKAEGYIPVFVFIRLF